MKQLFYLVLIVCFFAACGNEATESTSENSETVENQEDNNSPDEQELAENNDPEEDPEMENEEDVSTEEDPREEVAPSTETTTNSTHTNSSEPVKTTTKTTTTKEEKNTPVETTKTATKTNNTSDGGLFTTKTVTTKSNTKPNPKGISHDSWDQLMKQYVSSSGKVNYAGLKGQKSKIDAYLTHLGQNPPESSWSRNKEMAYWINLYNAFTISVILENYPVNSILDIAGGKVWTTKKIYVSGKAYTLDQIEKQQLLKKFGEPRVHFAVNCAAKSCPPLLNAAWTENNTQYQYEARAKAFINNAQYNEIDSKKVAVSKIFEWYAGDFGGSGNLINYLNKYSATTIKNNAKVSYKEYDWSLNK